MSGFPPSPKDFEQAMRRVEQGIATCDDADTIRQYVAELYEVIDYFYGELKAAKESDVRLQRALNEAFNSGSGAYIP
jgi:hypothetical protein